MPLSPSDLSEIAGWTSIGCWIVVYTPQLIENYLLQSGEGLSVAFIVLWLIGDVTNLVGGMMAGLLPTMLILAAYYTVCDIILLFQVYWYRYQASSALSTLAASSTTPLLPKDLDPPPAPLASPAGSGWRRAGKYAGALLAIALFGVGAWAISEGSRGVGGTGSVPGRDGEIGGEKEGVLEWKSQTLGWISAATYIGSRVPQILHNHRTKCSGLSLAMFCFSITGNLTYIASILFKSLKPRYLTANLPWLCGAGLTIFLDIFVLGQFFFFARQREQQLSIVPEADEQGVEQEERRDF